MLLVILEKTIGVCICHLVVGKLSTGKLSFIHVLDSYLYYRKVNKVKIIGKYQI